MSPDTSGCRGLLAADYRFVFTPLDSAGAAEVYLVRRDSAAVPGFVKVLNR